MLADREHLGNDLARFADNDGIADADALFLDEIPVVQSRAADGCACQKHRLKDSHGSEHARSADVDFNIEQLCRLLLGRIFVGFRPFRVLRGAAELLSHREVIHLYDRAVDSVVIFAAVVADFAYLLNHLVDSVADGVERSRKAKLREVVKALSVRCQRHAVDLLNVEYEYIERALGGYFGVLLAQRACRGISRILGGLLLVFLLPPDELVKALEGHIHLAANLEERRSVRDTLRKAFYCHEVVGHVLARSAVASC